MYLTDIPPSYLFTNSFLVFTYFVRLSKVPKLINKLFDFDARGE